MAGGHASQVGAVQRGEVRQRIGLEIGPEDFDRIELGRVGRQQDNIPVPSTQVTGDDLGAVARQPVPDEDKGTAQMTSECSKERNQPHGGDVLIGAQGKVQTWATPPRRQRQGGDDGHLVARAATLIQDRSVSAGRPAAPHNGSEQQAALVDEHQARVQAPRFFLMRGQSTFTHRWIAASSRSRARRSGFCGLQPSLRSTRPMWSTW